MAGFGLAGMGWVRGLAVRGSENQGMPVVVVGVTCSSERGGGWLVFGSWFLPALMMYGF